jgi:hypothetical protein
MRIDPPQAPGGGGGLTVGCILMVPEGDINATPCPFRLTVGRCMISGILAGAGLNPITARKPNRGHMTGQLPLARAQFLIKRISAFRAISHDNVTAMTPVLHPHNKLQPRLRESTGSHPHSRIAKNASRAFPTLFLFAPDAWLFERAMEVFSEGYLVGRPLVRLLPAHRCPSGG